MQIQVLVPVPVLLRDHHAQKSLNPLIQNNNRLSRQVSWGPGMRPTTRQDSFLSTQMRHKCLLTFKSVRMRTLSSLSAS